MNRSATLPFIQPLLGGYHPSGCNLSCQGSHLTAVALDRLVKAGVEIDEIRAVMDDEKYAHTPTRSRAGLSPSGRKNLVAWGATPAEVEEIEGEDVQSAAGEETGISFQERERRRVADYNAGLDPEVRRARARERSRRYRARQREASDV